MKESCTRRIINLDSRSARLRRCSEVTSPSHPHPSPPSKPPRLTFLVGQHLHAPTEHGLQHGVVPGECPHGGVVQRATHVKLDVFVAQASSLEAAEPGLGP